MFPPLACICSSKLVSADGVLHRLALDVDAQAQGDANTQTHIGPEEMAQLPVNYQSPFFAGNATHGAHNIPDSCFLLVGCHQAE